MQETNRKKIHTEEILPVMTRLIRRVWDKPRRLFLSASLLGLILLLICSFGCAPPPPDDGSGSSSGASNDLPEITEETISERINGARVRKVPEENGTAEPISWTFDEDEPKEIRVIEKQSNGARMTLLLDIKTWSAPDARDQRYLAGQIRTEWELQTNLVLRRWEIVKTENVSMKYKNLPKPPAQNSNR